MEHGAFLLLFHFPCCMLRAPCPMSSVIHTLFYAEDSREYNSERSYSQKRVEKPVINIYQSKDI